MGEVWGCVQNISSGLQRCLVWATPLPLQRRAQSGGGELRVETSRGAERPKLCRPGLKRGVLESSRGSAGDDEDEGALTEGVKWLGSGGGVGGTGVGVGGSRVRDSHSLVTDCRASERPGGERGEGALRVAAGRGRWWGGSMG